MSWTNGGGTDRIEEHHYRRTTCCAADDPLFILHHCIDGCSLITSSVYVWRMSSAVGEQRSVSNNFYDEAHNDTFGMSRTESFWWDQGEPIWVTAERQGVKSATFFWPGSEVSARSRCRSDSRRYSATLVQFRARTNFWWRWWWWCVYHVARCFRTPSDSVLMCE